MRTQTSGVRGEHGWVKCGLVRTPFEASAVTTTKADEYLSDALLRRTEEIRRTYFYVVTQADLLAAVSYPGLYWPTTNPRTGSRALFGRCVLPRKMGGGEGGGRFERWLCICCVVGEGHARYTVTVRTDGQSCAGVCLIIALLQCSPRPGKFSGDLHPGRCFVLDEEWLQVSVVHQKWRWPY